MLWEVPSLVEAVVPCEVPEETPCDIEVDVEVVSPRLEEAPRELDIDELSELL